MIELTALLTTLFALGLADVPAPARGDRKETFGAIPVLRIPDRDQNARSATQFVAAVENQRRSQTQDDAQVEVLAGNVPAFLRQMVPVRYVGTDANGVPHQVKIFVLPDYLPLGSDEDSLRFPFDRTHAGFIARTWGMVLPTPFLVDRIYEAAEVQLEPIPQLPCTEMVQIGYTVLHEAKVRDQANAAGLEPGMLVAGHKKDVVLTKKLISEPDRLAIYGWQRAGGKPIQPLSLFHEASYADYSHGIRLVDRVVLVDGEIVDLFELLEDPVRAPLVSKEGAAPGIRHFWNRF